MLIGKKVGLRAVEKYDLDKLKNWRNLEYFRNNFREVKEINSENQFLWYDKITRTPNDFMFSIVDLNNDELIGACGLLYINWVIRSADFSFYIGKNNEYISEEGYGYDAVKTLLEYGFKKLNLNKVWMELYEFDNKKLNFFYKMNFKKEGELRQNCFHEGKYYNSYIISLLSDEYFDEIE